MSSVDRVTRAEYEKLFNSSKAEVPAMVEASEILFLEAKRRIQELEQGRGAANNSSKKTAAA